MLCIFAQKWPVAAASIPYLPEFLKLLWNRIGRQCCILGCSCCWPLTALADLLAARGSVAVNRHARPCPLTGPHPRGTPRGPHVRPPLVRSRRQVRALPCNRLLAGMFFDCVPCTTWLVAAQVRMGHFASRCRIHIRAGHLGDIQPQQRADARLARPPVGHGGACDRRCCVLALRLGRC